MFCYECFKEYEEDYGMCPFCGADSSNQPVEPIHLIPGTLLNRRYLIGHAIGSGGFGIIYKAWDTKLETVIAVKEFFSPRLMTRAEGDCDVIVNKKSIQEYDYRKARFLAEARIMAKFGDHRSIPNVFEFFEENGTAYIVMELLNGIGLNTYLYDNQGRIDRDYAIHIINEVGNALSSLHSYGIVHRDVAPDNIFICSNKDKKIKLLDLGAAKLSSDDDTVIDIILKPGYSPTEQYDSTGTVGVWSDIYALGATLYVMLTGIKPDEATNRRIEDTLRAPIELDDTIPENLSNAVMKAMALDRHMRFNSVKEFLKAINGEKKVTTLVKEKKRRKQIQVIGILVALLILVIGGLFVANTYREMEVDAHLETATISVWYEAEAGSDEETAMNYIIQDFCSKFESVTVDLVRYSPDEYLDALNEAANKDALPNLFESTDVASSILDKAIDLSEVLESEQIALCNLLSDNYTDFYVDYKKIPLGFEVPVAIVITGGSSCIDYQADSFSSLNDFKGANIAFDSAQSGLLSKNFTISQYTEDNFAFGESECAVLITSTLSMRQYESRLISNDWHYSYYNNGTGNFVYEWSAGEGTNAEEMAAKRLISWMLGSSYQNYLMISFAQNGEIPLSTKCLSEYTSMTTIYDGMVGTMNSISFKN